MADSPAATGGFSPRQLALIAALAVVVIIAGLGLFALFSSLTAPPPPANPLDQTGEVRVIEPPRAVSDFTLTSHTGAPLSLSDLRGRAVLLYFGYTHCPDVCPLTLIDFRAVHEALGDAAEEVAFVFISVDGERDTPPALARYFELRNVDGFVTGLTGNDVTLRRISPDYGLFWERRTDTGSAAAYLVDHTASTFLLDAQGRLTTIFGFNTEPEAITARIIEVLESS